MSDKVRIQFPEALQDVLFSPGYRYRCAYGGRGGAKSFSFALAVAIRCAQEPIRVLCVREYQNSIKESVRSEIITAIKHYGLGSLFTFGESYIRGKNGSEILFKGIKRIDDNIKSFSHANICWVEEADSVSHRSWEVLIPTIREPGSEIWATWNPKDPNSAVQKRFIDNHDDGMIVQKVGWQDNPWFSDVLEDERKRDLRVLDKSTYDHIWEGKCLTRTDAQVLAGKCYVEEFKPKAGWNGPYFGMDFGFTNPSVLIRFWTGDDCLWIEYEAGGPRIDTSDFKRLIFDEIPECEKNTIRADSSRPETISAVVNSGYKMKGAKKWPGSVEDGIQWLRSHHRIVIHPRCKMVADESDLWSWKIDPQTDDILPILVKSHDHCWDAIRYGAEPMIRSRNIPTALNLGALGGSAKSRNKIP